MTSNRIRVAKRGGQWLVLRDARLMGLIPCRAAVYRATSYYDAQEWARQCAGFYAALEDYGASPVGDR